MKSKLNLLRIIHAATNLLCGLGGAAIHPALGEGRSTDGLTVSDVRGAEGLVRETISWIAHLEL